MKSDSLDTILANEEELAPSSGFFASVMQRVEDEALAPPPIPFPWKRAIPGIVLAVAVLAAGLIVLVRYAARAFTGFSVPAVHLAPSLARPVEQAGWVAAALLVSAASWLLSRRLAGRSGLL